MARQARNGKPAARRNSTDAPAKQIPQQGSPQSTARNSGTPLIIGLGASAGGFDAFKSFFSTMPARTGLAFVLVQHLDPRHRSLLSELLGNCTEMTVMQAEDGMAIVADHVFVIPPNAVMTVTAGILRITRPAPPRDKRRPIDMFFTSLAEDQGENAVCIILSGSGTDGTVGLRAIKEHGGLTLAQAGIDETALAGMPSSAAATGLVDYVMPAEAMPAKLIHYARHLAHVVRHKDRDGTRRDAREYLANICALLHTRLGRDFSEYKDKTLIRRIQRRMQVLQIDHVPAYIERLRIDPIEPELLFRDLLIGVTQFFRDADAFAALQERIVPQLLENRDADHPIRVWVPGCATGEEAYSIAIVLQEAIADRKPTIPVHLFGTDLDSDAVMIARHARYRKSLSGVSAKRFARWFVEEDDGYSPNKAIRDMCVFSVHDLVKDPPFSKLDLIACRNVMIYLNAGLQDRLARTFHYALRPGGYLFLGSSESLSRQSDLFAVVDEKHRLFRRHDGVAAMLPTISRPGAAAVASGIDSPRSAGAGVDGTAAHRIEQHARYALEKFFPAYMVIDRNHDILHFSGQTGRYVEPAPGAASFNLFKILKKELQPAAQIAVQKAAQLQQQAVQERIVATIDGDSHVIGVVAAAIAEPPDRLLVIAFQDHGPISLEPQAGTPDSVIGAQMLNRELQAVRGQLQASIDQLANANEELKSSNEEYQSVNEELQSANEELETSKEELTSINEELQTINSELAASNEALNRANSDLKNLLDSTQIATLFLDSRLRVKNFTPEMSKIFALRDGDRGRPVTEIVTYLIYDDLQRDVKTVLRTLSAIEREVKGAVDDAVFLMRILPYRTVDDVIDGVVLTFIDITERKRRENEGARLAAIVASSQDPVLWISLEGEIQHWNPAAERLLGLRADQAIGKSFSSAIPESRVQQPPLLEKIRRGEGAQHYEIERQSADGTIYIALNLFPIADKKGRVTSAGVIAHDITERKREEEYRSRLAAIVQSSDDAIVSKDLDGIIRTWNSGAERLFGYSAEEAVGRSIRMLVPPDRPDEEDDILAHVRNGRRFESQETVRLRKDGSAVAISLTVSPIKDADGRIIGASKIARDITERRRAEAFRTLMVDELNHRVKNTLATVQAIAAQSLRGTDVDHKIRETFESRLIALSKVHDLLTRDDWSGASLRDLLIEELDPFRSKKRARITCHGPDIKLTPKSAVAFAMAVHELATNAAKYGALSTAAGKVSVIWNIEQASPGVLQLTWTESGGPPVERPRRKGFGSRLIERGLSLELNGRAHLRFEPAGLVCTIEMPLPTAKGDD